MGTLKWLTGHWELLELLGDAYPKQWDNCLPQAKFAFNSMPNRTTKIAPFIIVYGKLPLQHMDIGSPTHVVPKVSEMLDNLIEIHQWVHQNIVEANAKYKEQAEKSRREVPLVERDFVMVHLRKGRFLVGSVIF